MVRLDHDLALCRNANAPQFVQASLDKFMDLLVKEQVSRSPDQEVLYGLKMGSGLMQWYRINNLMDFHVSFMQSSEILWDYIYLTAQTAFVVGGSMIPTNALLSSMRRIIPSGTSCRGQIRDAGLGLCG